MKINNLTVEHVFSLLTALGDAGLYPDDAQRFAQQIVNERAFEVEGEFKNGNKLVVLTRLMEIFGIVTPAGNLISAFSVYETQHVSHHVKHDVFLITGHDTLTEVASDGEICTEHTR